MLFCPIQLLVTEVSKPEAFLIREGFQVVFITSIYVNSMAR
jgi:hypothetical protein